MASGRLLHRKISRNAEIATAAAVIDQRLGIGHGGYAICLATWLIAYQDIEGRCRADAAWLKAEVMPRVAAVTPALTAEYLRLLATCGVFLYYEIEGGRYVQWEGFRRCNRKLNRANEQQECPAPTPDSLLVQPPSHTDFKLQLQLLPSAMPRKRSEDLSEGSKDTVAPFGAPVDSTSSDTASESSQPSGSTTSTLTSQPSHDGQPSRQDASAPSVTGEPPSSHGVSAPTPPRKRTALPFGPQDALEVLQAAAGGRFPADPYPRNLSAPLAALIRQFPDVEIWRLVGEWLAAGGERWRERIDARTVVKGGNFAAWVGESARWANSGRHSISEGKKTSGAAPIPAMHSSTKQKLNWLFSHG